MEKSSRRKRVWIDLWIARIGSVIAWFWLVVWALAGTVAVADLLSGQRKDSLDLFMPFICFGIAALHILLIRSFRRTKSLVGDFQLFASVLSRSDKKTVQSIAKALKKDPEWTRGRILEMCRRGYFTGQFDYTEEKIVFENVGKETTVIQCPGCGARNAVSRTGEKCVYCSAPLFITVGSAEEKAEKT